MQNRAGTIYEQSSRMFSYKASQSRLARAKCLRRVFSASRPVWATFSETFRKVYCEGLRRTGFFDGGFIETGGGDFRGFFLFTVFMFSFGCYGRPAESVFVKNDFTAI